LNITIELGKEFFGEEIEPVQVEIDAKNSYLILPNLSKSEGEIKITNEPYRSLLRGIFTNDTLARFWGSPSVSGAYDLGVTSAGLDFRDNEGSLRASPATLKINADAEKINSFEFSEDELEISGGNGFGATSVRLGGVGFGASYADGIKFEDFTKIIADSKSSLNIATIDIRNGFASGKIEGLKSEGSLGVKDGKFDVKFETKLGAIDAMGVKIAGVNLNGNFAGLDKAAYEKFVAKGDYMGFKSQDFDFAEIFDAASFDLDEFSILGEKGDKFTLNLKAWVDTGMGEIANRLNLKGSLKSTNSLSAVLGGLDLTSAYENALIAQGVLIKDGAGYKADFELNSAKDNLIFNGNIPLNSLFGEF
jgi:hypothetical protein